MLTSQFRNVYIPFNGSIFNEHYNKKKITEQNYGRELQPKMTLYTFYQLETNKLSEPCSIQQDLNSLTDLLKNKAKYSLLKHKVLNLSMISHNLKF